MKTLKLMMVVPAMALFLQTAFAQKQLTGLYLTAKDYQENKLSCTGDKINLHGFLASDKVTVMHNGTQQSFLKSEIFGYKTGNKEYRFFKNEAYQVLENKIVLIYAHSTLEPQGKGLKPVEQYYFSVDNNEPVMALTKANLEKAYGKDSKFVYAIDGYFKNDSDLKAYDSYNKEYKLAYLYANNQ